SRNRTASRRCRRSVNSSVNSFNHLPKRRCVMKTAEKISVAGGSTVPPLMTSWARLGSPKIQLAHREKLAIVYVRQSTQKQVMENQESTARQYAFAEDAVASGWPRERVLVLGVDRGKSGRTAEGRTGFQGL